MFYVVLTKKFLKSKGQVLRTAITVKNKAFHMVTTERIANQNHKDVVLELQADGRDKPSLRLVKTKRAGISTMPNEFSRWGAYIFLTKDKLPNQISWKDENGESDE